MFAVHHMTKILTVLDPAAAVVFPFGAESLSTAVFAKAKVLPPFLGS